MRFACSCGRFLKVDDQCLGKKVMCPACGAVLWIRPKPEFAAGPPRPRREDAKVSPVPSQRQVVVDDDEEIPPPKRHSVRDEDEKDRPRRKKKPAGGTMSTGVVLAGAAAVGLALVLVGGGVAAHWLVSKKDTPTVAEAAKSPEKSPNSDRGLAGKVEPVTVRLSVPAKVGDVVETTFKSDMTTNAADQTPKGNKNEDITMTIRFQGTAKTLAVDADGRNNLDEITVTRFRINKGKGEIEPLPANAVFVRDARAIGPVLYTPKDIALSAEALEALQSTFGKTTKDDADDPSDEALFGTKEKKRVGDS
jgi:hypothetical protein